MVVLVVVGSSGPTVVLVDGGSGVVGSGSSGFVHSQVVQSNTVPGTINPQSLNILLVSQHSL